MVNTPGRVIPSSLGTMGEAPTAIRQTSKEYSSVLPFLRFFASAFLAAASRRTTSRSVNTLAPVSAAKEAGVFTISSDLSSITPPT